MARPSKDYDYEKMKQELAEYWYEDCRTKEDVIELFISGTMRRNGKPLHSQSDEEILKTYNQILGKNIIGGRKPPLKGKTKIIRIKDGTSK